MPYYKNYKKADYILVLYKYVQCLKICIPRRYSQQLKQCIYQLTNHSQLHLNHFRWYIIYTTETLLSQPQTSVLESLLEKQEHSATAGSLAATAN